MSRDRFTFPDGDWVDLTARLNHAQRRRIIAARGTPEVATESVAAMVLAWSLRDVEGAAIPFPGAELDGVAASAMDAIPMDSFDAIAQRAIELIESAPSPKGTPPPLSE